MKLIVLFLAIFGLFNNFAAAQTGCTDALALNYNANALTNDGSCAYAQATVFPSTTINLSPTISETSGLIDWNNFLYTHNDNTDTKIYQLSKITGDILQEFPLNTIQNIDWEEISQDDNYIYIGDFGNNANGNRTDLKIYKINKNTLDSNPQIETINFSYSDQIDFSPKEANTTDFDCEAFVVTANEILLFTKQWTSTKTNVYSLSKTPGTYVANLTTTIDVSGLITGAGSKENSRIITLCGYSKLLQPFLFLLYDYNGNDFAAANKRKIELALPFHQIEAIATTDGLEYSLTNESFIQSPFINNPQQLHKLSLATYLNNYLSTNNPVPFNEESIVYPNPTDGEIYIKHLEDENQWYQVIDINGKTLKSGNFVNSKMNISNLGKGIYFLKITATKQVYKIIKK